MGWCGVMFFLILRDETNDEDGNNDTLSLLELMINKEKKYLKIYTKKTRSIFWSNWLVTIILLQKEIYKKKIVSECYALCIFVQSEQIAIELCSFSLSLFTISATTTLQFLRHLIIFYKYINFIK